MIASISRPWLATLLVSLSLSFCAQAQLREFVLEGPFEDPPVLEPAKDLLPEYLAGPNHKVTGSIITSTGHNQYIVESEFGNCTADGSVALVQLVDELKAIAKLRLIAGTEGFAAALKKTGEGSSALAKEAIKLSITTTDGLPSAPWLNLKMASLAQEATGPAKGTGAAKAPAKTEEAPLKFPPGNKVDTAKDFGAFAKTKRQLAALLGVDAYSTNTVLQKDLNNVAWVAYGSGTAADAIVTLGGDATKPAADKTAAPDATAAEVRADAQAKLAKMGISKDLVAAFLANPNYSPTAQAAFVTALGELPEKIAGRAELVTLAKNATTPADATFNIRCAQMAVGVGKQVAPVRIITHRGLAVYIAEDGVAFIPLEWDYAVWNETMGQFINSLKISNFAKDKITLFHIVFSGVTSDRCNDEIKQRDYSLSEKSLPCPLKQEVKTGYVPAQTPAVATR